MLPIFDSYGNRKSSGLIARCNRREGPLGMLRRLSTLRASGRKASAYFGCAVMRRMR
jgi:hypothetical protein